MKEYIKRSELSELSGLHYQTIKNYIRAGALTEFLEGRPRRFKAKEALAQLKELKRLQGQGYSIEMIADKFAEQPEKVK